MKLFISIFLAGIMLLAGCAGPVPTVSALARKAAQPVQQQPPAWPMAMVGVQYEWQIERPEDVLQMESSTDLVVWQPEARGRTNLFISPMDAPQKFYRFVLITNANS